MEQHCTKICKTIYKCPCQVLNCFYQIVKDANTLRFNVQEVVRKRKNSLYSEDIVIGEQLQLMVVFIVRKLTKYENL